MSVLASSLKPWPGQGIGLPRALLVALLIEALTAVLLLWRWHDASAPSPAMPRQVTTVAFVKLPPPSPPKPAPVRRIVPPPAPKPDIVIPKKLKPHPVVHHKPKPLPKPKPVHHVVHHKIKPVLKPKPVHHKPVPKPKPVPQPIPSPKVVPHPAPQVVDSPVPAPKVAPVSGPSPSAIAAYSQALHLLIQNNVQVGEIVRQMGLSGAVRVSFVLDPKGGAAHDVRVISNGANPLIRRDALETISRLRYPPFPASFGPAPRSFAVVVQINTGG